MPGTNAGTGYALTFKCVKCRRARWYDYRKRHGMNYVATGRTRKKPTGRGRIRCTDRMIEYRCRDCQHVGWSMHDDLERALARLEEATS